MKTIFLFFVLVIALAGCDVVTKHYDTYAEAKKDALFIRGWLPEVIPASSFRIVTSNNLDLNTSEGEFSFRATDGPAFIAKLRPYTGRKTPFANYKKTIKKRANQGYVAYEYVEQDYSADKHTVHQSTWVFFVNREKGHVYYDLWFEKRAG